MNPRIAVLGTGANGAAIAADLVNAGLDVTLIEQWPAHVDAMRRDGVRINMPHGALVVAVRVHHLCEVAEMRRRFDLVFLAVKAYDTRWACELIAPVLADDALVVGVQNGMTMDRVASIVGPGRSVGAVIEIASSMFEPGVVERETGPEGTWFAIGADDAGVRARLGEVAEALAHAGAVELTGDIRSAKWMKLVANAAEVLPSAILNLPLADALAVPGIREVMDACGSEALRTGLDLGYRIVPMFGSPGIEEQPPESYAAALLDAVVAGWTSPKTRVALLQDWMKGRRGEVDDMNGVVVTESRRLGGSAPVNEGVVELARQIERGELDPDVGNAAQLRACLDVALPT